MESEEIVSNGKELSLCPEDGCSGSVHYVDPSKGIVSNGEGIATADVECKNEDCDFTAEEVWVIDVTRKTR